jgi:hypothetical protein
MGRRGFVEKAKVAQLRALGGPATLVADARRRRVHAVDDVE